MLWRKINIEGTAYLVSQNGQVMTTNYRRTGKEHLLLPQKVSSGYLGVVVGGKMTYIHRLVATAFPEICGCPDNDKTQVNHLNEDKTDNRAENLQWITAAGNVKYSLDLHKPERDAAKIEKLQIARAKLQEERAARKAARLAKREAKKQKEAEEKAAAEAKREEEKKERKKNRLLEKIVLWRQHYDKILKRKYVYGALRPVEERIRGLEEELKSLET